MGELTEYIKERYFGNNKSESKELMKKQKVKNAILMVCDKYIEDTEEVLTFEVKPSDLPYVSEVLLEEPLKSKYQIMQTSDTLFVAKLRELEL